MITHATNKCTNCGVEDSIVTNFNAGQVECKACGAVLEDRIIDETYEGRNFGNENQTSGKDQTRVGGPMSRYAEDITPVNVVSKHNGDISTKMRHRSSGVKSSNNNQICSKMEKLGEKLGLALSTLNIAKDLLSDLERKDKLKGRSLESIIASVFYFACRQEGIPRKLSQISKVLNLEQKTVNKSFNMIKGYVNKTLDDQITKTVSGLVRQCCDSIQDELKDQNKNVADQSKETSKFSELKKYSSEICELICKKEIIAGRNPSTIAAASVLIASKLLGMKIGKKDIANSTSTTENTISNAYNELIKFKEYIIPDKLKSEKHLLEKN